eukprot:224308-Pyramimonas_sp.AAC.1
MSHCFFARRRCFSGRSTTRRVLCRTLDQRHAFASLDETDALDALDAGRDPQKCRLTRVRR